MKDEAVPNHGSALPPSLSNAIDIEQVGKVLGGLALFLYVTGLLAVNGYLFRLGASDFTLVRVRFMYTGAVIFSSALFVILSIAVGLTLIRSLFRGAPQEKRFPGWEVPITILLIPLYLGVPASLLTDLLSIGHPSPIVSQPAMVLTGAGVFLGLSLTLLWRAYLLAIDHFPRRLVPAYVALVGVFALFSWGIYTATFMSYGYAKIPVQFGGGRPRAVQLLIVKDATAATQQLGLSFSSNEQLSDPVELLYESDEQYVLRLSNGRTATVNKGIVAGVIS